jgi:NADPH-dependent curcumin reductase CurA
MANDKNLALIFKRLPQGFPKAGQDLTVEDLGADAAQLPSDGIVARVIYSSLDPYLRGLLRDPSVKSYFPPLPIGGPVKSAGVAKVEQSNNGDYKVGDLILGRLPIQQVIALSGEELKQLKSQGLNKLDTTGGPSDIDQYLGVLGMPGLTAYSSLYEIGKPQKGETIFISSAAGAVGQLVGQLAKHEGLRVIGSVGNDEKLQYIKDLGFDDGFNYKTEKPIDALHRLAPDGVDIYYENVGGEQLEAALECMNPHGRIVACGMISDYNVKNPEDRYPIRNLMLVVGKQLTMRGFLVANKDFGPKHREEVRLKQRIGQYPDSASPYTFSY